MTLRVMRLIATLRPTFVATWCNYFTRQYAKCYYFNVVVLSAIMLSVVMLSVVMLNVVAPLSVIYRTFSSGKSWYFLV
jgi:hypothetical protein